MSAHDGYARGVLAELCSRFPLGYEPQLIWKSLRVTAGVAYYRTGIIALSNRVLTTEQDVRETLTHEYAHLLAVHRHGKKGIGHGAPWRRAMADLGLEPKVRHTYSVERNRARQTVTYRCARCGVQFSRPRRFPRRARYVHADCGGDLRLVAVQSVTSGTNHS